MNDAEVRFERFIPLETHAEFARVRFEPENPDPDVNVKGHIPIHIAFGEREIRREHLGRLGGFVEEFVSRPVFGT